MRARALVADDEPKARRHLLRLLREEAWIQDVAEARDGEEAVAIARRMRPELLFLDVCMPGMDGLSVLGRLESRPLVIFTTAHDRYAVTAFELEAVDYLLKPFGRARLRQALERARRALDAGGRAEAPLRRLFAPERGRLVAVDLDRVDRIAAERDYLRVRAGGRELLLRERLTRLARRLDPERFVRVHRSFVVNLDHVARVEPAPGGRLRLRLRDGSEVTASRRLTPLLRRRLA